MSAVLHRLGLTAFRRPLLVILTWLVVLGGVIGFAVASEGHISTSLTIDVEGEAHNDEHRRPDVHGA